MRDALIIDYNFLDLIFSVACFSPLYFQEIIFFILNVKTFKHVASYVLRSTYDEIVKGTLKSTLFLHATFTLGWCITLRLKRKWVDHLELCHKSIRPPSSTENTARRVCTHASFNSQDMGEVDCPEP